MRGQRGRLPVQPLGYVMSTKVIFRRAEVCLPRRPHAFWKDMMNIYSSAFHVRRHFLFSLRTWEGGKTVCGRLGRQTSDFRSSKNNFRGHDISRPTPWDSLSVLSFSLDYRHYSACKFIFICWLKLLVIVCKACLFAAVSSEVFDED